MIVPDGCVCWVVWYVCMVYMVHGVCICACVGMLYIICGCLSQGLYSCTKHHGLEASWEGKGLFTLHFHIVVHHQRKSGQELTLGRNLEAGADAEAMEGCYLLACFPWLAQPALL